MSLSVKIFPDTVATDPAAQLMKCLVKSSSRWKAITLSGNKAVEKFLAATRPLNRFPTLEELTIHIHAGGPSARMWYLLRVPTLHEVSLKFDVLQPLELPLCWTQLVHLDLDCAVPGSQNSMCLTVDGAIELLQRCHRLQTCTLHVVHHDILPISFPIVALESMHTFCLFQSFGVPCLLEHVLMPHLRIFRLRHHRTDTSAVEPSFCLDALLGVSTELHTLDLFLDCIMPEKLLASFPAMDSITHLTSRGARWCTAPGLPPSLSSTTTSSASQKPRVPVPVPFLVSVPRWSPSGWNKWRPSHLWLFWPSSRAEWHFRSRHFAG